MSNWYGRTNFYKTRRSVVWKKVGTRDVRRIILITSQDSMEALTSTYTLIPPMRQKLRI